MMDGNMKSGVLDLAGGRQMETWVYLGSAINCEGVCVECSKRECMAVTNSGVVHRTTSLS
jgi:hypothetical protein